MKPAHPAALPPAVALVVALLVPAGTLAQPAGKTDPVSLGAVRLAREVRAAMEARVAAAIPHDPRTFSYPAMWSEYIGHQLEANPKGRALVLPAGTRLAGDLDLDWDTAWVQQHGIAVVFAEGDLTVQGSVVNLMLEGGPMLFVAGNLRARHVRKGGAPVLVLGNLTADGWVIGEYNDGVMRIGGDLEAEVFALFDHDGFVRGKKRAKLLSDDEIAVWGEHLVPEVLDDPADAESYPDVDRIWERLLKGAPVLRAP